MKIKVEKIHPHPINGAIYELSNIDDLVTSIREVGLLQPLIINQRNQIISGHRRYEAIKQLDWKQVEVEKIETTDEDMERVLLIAHNKQRVKSTKELLAEARTIAPTLKIGQGSRSDLLTSSGTRRSGRTDQLVADAIGISRDKYNKISSIEKWDKSYIDLVDSGVITINQAFQHLDRLRREQNLNKDTKSNQPFDDPRYTFYKKSSHVMLEIDDESIQTIITSPPYYKRRAFAGTLGTEKTPQEFVDNLVDHLEDCWRVLKPKGSFFLNLDDTYVDGGLASIPSRVVIKLQDKGWLLRNQVVWRKLNPKPLSSKKSLTNSYELIFHLTKSTDHDYYPTNIPAKNDHSPFHVIRHKDQVKKARIVHPVAQNELKNLGNFWTNDIVETAVARTQTGNVKEHPAPMAEKVVYLPILQTSREGEIVLDPFSGTGTTGKVAISLNRHFVGYDLEEY